LLHGVAIMKKLKNDQRTTASESFTKLMKENRDVQYTHECKMIKDANINELKTHIDKYESWVKELERNLSNWRDLLSIAKGLISDRELKQELVELNTLSDIILTKIYGSTTDTTMAMEDTPVDTDIGMEN